MSLSNPASRAAEDAEEYVAGLLALLGDEDPLRVQERLVADLRWAVEGLGERQLRTPEAPGKWSVMEVVQHLADTELVYRYRMRKSVAQPGSEIAGYDQDVWARDLRYADGSLEEALELLETLRTANLAWIRRLSEEELDRAGIHAERGRERVRDIVALLAAHDRVHLRQIERIKEAVGATA